VFLEISFRAFITYNCTFLIGSLSIAIKSFIISYCVDSSRIKVFLIRK